jgi:hypothetical protein
MTTDRTSKRPPSAASQRPLTAAERWRLAFSITRPAAPQQPPHERATPEPGNDPAEPTR